MNNMTIIPTKCDCCGEMVPRFSDKSDWFGKYLKDDEEKICLNCIKGRDGYAEEFKKQIGVTLEEARF